MKTLILNSGIGSRMGKITENQPKCMTKISDKDTILSRQLRLLVGSGINEVIITTGPFEDILINYCKSLELPIHFTFVKNELYKETNYIYSIYKAKEYFDDDILLMHGDLVFEYTILDEMIKSKVSCMAVSTMVKLQEKDFKAVIENGHIVEICTMLKNNMVSAWPLYMLKKEDWKAWLENIEIYCQKNIMTCYAEDAFREVANRCLLFPFDIKERLCNEVDNYNDLVYVSNRLKDIEERVIYMCFSTDILHSGHIAIIRKAEQLGRLMIGVLSDEAVASYRRFPMLPFSERKIMFENIVGVDKVVEQKSLSYRENLEKYHPNCVVHGDDWNYGFQRPVREEVTSVLESYGGKLIEFPYTKNKTYENLEKRVRIELALPDIRRARLKKILGMKKIISAIEAHSGITGLIAEKTTVYQKGEACQFDAIWVSSLCDSTAKGKPDIELVDITSRLRTIDDIMEVTTKPIIFDGDTGGLIEHFVYTVRTLERMGVSMVIIEDKTGLKKNSLFGTEVKQTQDSVENFCAKITAGKRAQRTRDFMICARIESLIAERGMNDALERAFAYVSAGSDAIMIHSRKNEPTEIFEFMDKFRKDNQTIPIVVVPTSFNMVTEEEFKNRGANIVIYANQLTRAGFPAMQNAAKSILTYHRAKECDSLCMPIKEIITLIPEEI